MNTLKISLKIKRIISNNKLKLHNIFIFNIILLIIFLLVNIEKGSTQYNCSNIPIQQEALRKISNTERSNNQETLVKIYFHVYRDNQGNGGVNINRLNTMINNINTYYEGTGISFFYNECEVRFVNNTTLFQSNDRCNFFFQGWEHEDGIDVHVNGDNSPSQAVAAGIPGGEIFLSGRYDSNTIVSSSAIFGHEMGHCLGLFHTHRGIGLCETQDEISCGIEVEGGNPIDGDFVEDTPPDPGLGGNVNNNCHWNGNSACQASGQFNPLINNFMSYTPPTCLNNFTQGQITRMHALMWPSISTSTPSPQFGIILYVNQPTCGGRGSITAELDCPTQPHPLTFLWSNGANTQTIDNLLPGTYSVTISNTFGYQVTASTSIIEEIIVSSDHPNWSDVIVQYSLSSSQLTGRNIFVEENLFMDVNYSFNDVTFGFAKGAQITIKDDVTVQIQDDLGKKSILRPCDGEWNGIVLESGANLVSSNTEVYDAKSGIIANNNSYLTLNAFLLRGYFGTVGIDLNGEVKCKTQGLTIENYQTGIKGVNNTSVPHFYFTTINNSDVGFDLIASPVVIVLSSTESRTTSINLDNCPGSILGINIFSSGDNGIIAINSPSLSIINPVCNSFLKTAIDLNGCSNSSITDEFNSTNGYNIKATEYGLKVRNCSNFKLSYNEFQIEGNNVSHGIQLTDCHDSKATDNKFLLSSNKMGVETINGSNNEIANNTFEYSSGSVFPLARAAVIRTLGSESETIHNNNINGPGLLSGIHAINSSGNTYSCNDLSGILDGLGVYYNSAFHDIKGNHFLNCATDLKIRSVIGPQYYKGNEFYNGNCFAEGLTSEEIGQSWFFVNQNIPHHMPSNPIPGNGQWFRHQDVNEYFDDCPEVDPRGGRTGFDDERILSDHFDRLKLERSVSPERFLVYMMHLLEYDYAREDYSLPQYIIEDPVWLELSDWTALAEAINSLGDISGLSGQSALNQNDLNSLSMLQNAYAEAEDEATRELIYMQLSELMFRLSPAFDHERLIDSLETDRLKNQFRSLSGRTDQMVSRWADIYTMYIDFLQKGEVDESNKARLLAYSRECADKYGDAIHLARAVANTFNNTYFDIYDDCPEDIQPRTASNTLNAIVQPNPTKGELNIVLENPFTGTIEMFDITGKLVYSDKCENIFEKTIHLNLNEGVFMMKITSVEGDSDIEKVLITK